ncbi:PT domain-containing protein [Streptomyces asoensis]|uniref:Uncharacterized protein n=1 Tax=Streptomyces asoensis TaxID=249586 RepID=A0ABQ3S2I5_9ACTN|nr:PT domain-containing protein [Streptomyces asoensis]GGQ90284.1 hypothetical protein GCM10010496_63690 [Streptomyces asoensis]GHI62338.1 hypothetical protein Saso_39880 [Streptomyces asoensis]
MDGWTDPRAAMGTLPQYPHAHQDELVSAAGRGMAPVAAAVLGDGLVSVDADRTDGRQFFVLTDSRGGTATVWVDAVPLVRGTLADTATNTTSQHYVIRVSDRLPTRMLHRVLARELGELMAVRERAAEGLAPVREDSLREGTELPSEQALSVADRGRVGELNWLAARSSAPDVSPEQQAQARAEFSALLDPYGMRPTAAMSDEEAFRAQERAARARYRVAFGSLSTEAVGLLDTLAHPIEALPPADATALRAARDAAVRAERQVEAFIGRREITMPMPGYDQNGLPLPRDQLEPAAERWAQYREQVSERTVGALEGQLAAGQFPLRKVVIGGGASLTGRDPEALLVDAAGRWHLDPGNGIVQSADQDRDLAQWMGVDPYAAVEDPRHRVSIHAVRVWEDQLATQGDVVNGRARLRLGLGGELLAEIRPSGPDGQESDTPLWVACDGTPSIATGLTPDAVPGMPRGATGVESRSEAVRLIGDRLRELEGQAVPGARELRAWLTLAERGGADARTVLGALESSALKDALMDGLDEETGARMDNCFTALDSTGKWETAREAAPGRALLGDEVAENRFDPRAAQHWIIAGSGGTGVANAEIILRENPDAYVTIIGNAPPDALRHQVQYPEMLERYTTGENPRLTIGRTEVGAVETYQHENGETWFQADYVIEATGERRTARAAGYVCSLGRTNPLPPALQVLADEVRDRGGEISGDLQFDRDDQYIGYGLTFAVDGREHRVDVDGAASWQLPREIFAPKTGVQAALNEMGQRGLPSETGNAAPGFSPIARQSALRARAVAEAAAGDPDAVRRLPTVPERWQRPDLTRPSTVTSTAPAPAPAPVAMAATAPTAVTPAVETETETETAAAPGTQADTPAEPTAQPTAQPTSEPTAQPAPEASAQHAPEASAGRGAPAAPAPGISGSHLWQMGVHRGGAGRPNAPDRQEQQPPPPGHEPPEPGVGLDD